MKKEVIQNLNVILLPPKKISQEAIKLSNEIAREFETFFILNNENCIPHISLYHAAYPAKNLSKIKEVITSIANNTSTFPVELKTTFWQKEGWIDFQAAKSKSLLELHNDVIEKLNYLRENNLMQDDVNNFSTHSQEEREMLRLYGYRLSKDLFRPHLTVTRLNGGDIELAAEKLEGNDLSFEAKEVALCRLGNYGTCINILEKWNIK